MSTREPDKKRSKEAKNQSKATETVDETAEDWLDSFTVSQSATQQETVSGEQEAEVQHPAVDELLAEFVRQLPQWINKPWMYVKPTHEGLLDSWYDSWKQLILKYTEVFTIHIINVYDLQVVHPFTNQSSGRELSADQIKAIIDNMIEDNLAKWLDNDTTRARIYFTTDTEWAEIIYQFTLDRGYATDILTLYDLHELQQPWSSLPDGELRIILDILVVQNKAEWVGSEKDTIQFKL